MSKVLARSATVLQAADRTERALELEIIRFEDAQEAAQVVAWLDECMDAAWHRVQSMPPAACPNTCGLHLRQKLSEATDGFVRPLGHLREMIELLPDEPDDDELGDPYFCCGHAARWPIPLSRHDTLYP